MGFYSLGVLVSIQKDGGLIWSQWARSPFSSHSMITCVQIDATVGGENNNNVVGYPHWLVVLPAVWTCGKPHAHGGGVRHHRTISDRPLPMLPTKRGINPHERLEGTTGEWPAGPLGPDWAPIQMYLTLLAIHQNPLSCHRTCFAILA